MRLTLYFLISLACAGPLTGQCTEHWRWDQKISLAQLALNPRYTSINQMLTSWGVPEMYRGSASRCVERQGRELSDYYLYGWVRRVRKGEADGDWHVELTASRTGTVPNRCIVVEIPSPAEGDQYQIVRDQFDALLDDAGATINGSGDVSPAVRMKFVGAAFFDAEHRGARGTTNPPSGHGRCNRDSRSLWELHPVYGVFAP